MWELTILFYEAIHGLICGPTQEIIDVPVIDGLVFFLFVKDASNMSGKKGTFGVYPII